MPLQVCHIFLSLLCQMEVLFPVAFMSGLCFQIDTYMVFARKMAYNTLYYPFGKFNFHHYLI